jgi:hypothetical protein
VAVILSNWPQEYSHWLEEKKSAFRKSLRRKQRKETNKDKEAEDRSGANPTIVSYNASVVIFNATGSLARFENKSILVFFEKRSSLLQRWRCSCKFNSRRIGSWVVSFSQYKIVTK